MIKMLEDKREAVVQLCTRFGVSRLDVFGSALQSGSLDEREFYLLLVTPPVATTPKAPKRISRLAAANRAFTLRTSARSTYQ